MGSQQTFVDLGDGLAMPPMDGHDVAIGPEAVDLRVRLAIGIGPTGHQVDEIVVGVHAGPLIESLRCFDGQGVELELLRQEVRHAAVVGLVVEVEPEERGAGQRGLDVLDRGRHVVLVLAMQGPDHGSILTDAFGLGWDGQANRAGSNPFGRGGSSAPGAWPVMAQASSRLE